MPIGYMAKLYDGEQTFAQFATRFANAFFYDSDAGSPPEPVGVAPFYHENLQGAFERLNNLISMDREEIAAAARQHNADQNAEWAEEIETKRARRLRYSRMLGKAMAWRPPTPDHQGLKDYMVNSLREALDGYEVQYVSPYYNGTPHPVTAAEWFEREVTDATDDIRRYSERLNEEIDLVQKRNAWIRQLWESL